MTRRKFRNNQAYSPTDDITDASPQVLIIRASALNLFRPIVVVFLRIRSALQNTRLFLLYTAALVIFRWGIMDPKIIPASDSTYDDELFVSLATNITFGKWLGPFTHMTLAKPPGLPVILALMNMFRLSYTGTTDLLHVLCSSIVGYFIFRNLRLHYVAFIIVTLLVLDPNSIRDQMNRVGPHTLIQPLFLVIFALVGGVYSTLGRPQWVYGVLLAIAVGAYPLLRWEAIWLLPVFPATAVIGFIARFCTLRTSLILALLPLCGFVLATSAVRSLNSALYGVPFVTDFSEGAFPRAYARLVSIRGSDRQQYLPLPRTTRMAVYDASPSFASLKVTLEVPGFWDHGCVPYPHTCGDIASGWLVWALRDAAASTGYYSSARVAERFWSQVDSELNSACQNGKLDCLTVSWLPVGVPHTTSEVRTLGTNLREALIGFSEAWLPNFRSSGVRLPSPDVANLIAGNSARFSRFDLVTDTNSSCILSFVTHSRFGFPLDSDRVRCADVKVGGSMSSHGARYHIDRVAWRPMAVAPNDLLRSQMFERITLSRVRGPTDPSTPIRFEVAGWAVSRDMVSIVPIISSPLVLTNLPAQFPLDATRFTIQWSIAILYYTYIPWCFGIFIVIYIAAFITSLITKKARIDSTTFILVTFVLFTIFTRAAVLALVTTTEFPAISTLYFHCQSYVLICVGFLPIFTTAFLPLLINQNNT